MIRNRVLDYLFRDPMEGLNRPVFLPSAVLGVQLLAYAPVLSRALANLRVDGPVPLLNPRNLRSVMDVRVTEGVRYGDVLLVDVYADCSKRLDDRGLLR